MGQSRTLSGSGVVTVRCFFVLLELELELRVERIVVSWGSH